MLWASERVQHRANRKERTLWIQIGWGWVRSLLSRKKNFLLTPKFPG